jgi:hypothetical protein
MAKKKFLKGSPLFALARSKAGSLNIETAGLKLEPLIREIQTAEGHEPCFRVKDRCSQMQCCWQASCGAKMVVD